MYERKYHKYKHKYELEKRKRGGNKLQMTYTNRIEFYNKLYDKVKNMNDCQNKGTKLKEGGHANIFKKTVDNIPISLKIQKAPGFVLNNKKHKITQEYEILKKCTELVLNKTTQNLPILYNINVCQKEQEIIFYSELANGDFIDWLSYDHSENEWMTFLFQFWVGVYTMQTHLKVVHNDLRLANVLYHKIDKIDEYWKYNIGNIDYYIPNEGYVFVIWDFGSANIIENSQDINKNKLDLSLDLHFFHDLYNRIRMIVLFEKYTLDELLEFFTTSEELNYVKEKKQECTQRFAKTGRFDEKCKIALIYYLLETDKFDEFVKKGSQNTAMKIPPPKIMKLLKELSETNYKYDDVIKILYNPKVRIIKNAMLSPDRLIAKYFTNFKVKHDFNLEFNV